MIPEAAIAVLACTRIGAIHSVVFGGFSPDSLSDRNNDAESKVLITADGGWRRGGAVNLKANSDEAMKTTEPSVDGVLRPATSCFWGPWSSPRRGGPTWAA